MSPRRWGTVGVMDSQPIAARLGTAAAGVGRSCRTPPRPYPPGHALEGTVVELAHQEPRWIDRARHGGAALGNALEAGLAVILLVAHQHDQPMRIGLRLRQRP